MQNTRYVKYSFQLLDSLNFFNFVWAGLILLFSTVIILIAGFASSLFILIPIVLIFDLILITVTSQLRKKVEPTSTYEGITEQNLPSNLSPAHVRMFVNNGCVDTVSITATLLDLLDRKIIDIIENTSGQKSRNPIRFFLKNEDMTIIRIDFENSNLAPYEVEILDWFINDYGDGKQVTLNQIKEGLGKSDNAVSPSDRILGIQQMVISTFKTDEYYQVFSENSKIMGKIAYTAGIILVICFLAMFGAKDFGNSYIFSVLYYIIFNFSASTLMFFTLPCNIYSQFGINEFFKWKALKLYLEQYSLIAEKDIKDICLWEHYLTYAVALDVNVEISEKLDAFYGQEIYKTNEVVQG